MLQREGVWLFIWQCILQHWGGRRREEGLAQHSDGSDTSILNYSLRREGKLRCPSAWSCRNPLWTTKTFCLCEHVLILSYWLSHFLGIVAYQKWPLGVPGCAQLSFLKYVLCLSLLLLSELEKKSNDYIKNMKESPQAISSSEVWLLPCWMTSNFSEWL
jgi:hypothetical protein